MKYVIGNWKMHTTVPEAVALAGKIEDGLHDQVQGGQTLPTVVLCPPFVSLTALSDVVDGRVIQFGAQNMHWEPSGPFTGEISSKMLKDLVRYVIIGHSERRLMGETDEQIAQKVAAAYQADLCPILCVGEAKPTDQAAGHVEDELREGLAAIDPKSVERLIVAYEPIWAVGTGSPADEKHIGEVISYLKEILAGLGVKSADVVYGGGITKQSVKHVLTVPGVDGLLVGGASLNDQEFLSIVGEVARQYGT